MALQQIFRQKYVDELRNGVSERRLISYYESDTFEFNPEEVWQSPEITKADSINLLIPDSVSLYDFENSVRVYEAYKDLTPLQASDIRLWTYLTHVDLYKYVSNRWPSVRDKRATNPTKYILDHWFISSPSQTNFLRHSIAGLWWAAYLTYDETREDRYELTKLIYRQLDVPQRTLGTYNLARHKEAVIGILEYIQQNPATFKNNYQNKLRFVTRYLNQIGGTKPISYFHRDFFKSSLHAVKDKIEAIKA